MSSNKRSQYIKIADDTMGYDLSHFCVPSHYEDVLDSVLISNGMIKDRIEKMAQEISLDENYMKNGVVALCVLKGGFRFFADLTDALDRNNRIKEKSVPMSIEFIKIKSYKNQESTGNVSISGLTDKESIRGKNLIIVEDLVDTGRTMVKLIAHLKTFNPASVRCASLLLKRTPLSNGYIPDYVGFEIPERFLVGYSMDYNEHFRDLNHLCVMNEKGKTKYQE